MGNEVSYDIPEGNDHLTAQEFATWQADASPTAEHERLTDHLIACASCSAQLVMIRQAVDNNKELEQSPEFTNLLRAGETAARQAYQQQSESVSSPNQVVERPQAVTKPSFWQQLFGLQPALRWGIAVVFLAAILLPLYWYRRQNQPVELAMVSLRGAWPEDRPIEARVTGGFPYHPYRVTRGSGDKAKVDDIKLLDATSRLTETILEKPSSQALQQALQALGKIQLLNTEYEKAEKQLRDAIKRDPQNASAYIDLAACLFERGKVSHSISFLNDAEQQAQKALEIDPRIAEGWFNLALIREEIPLPARAIEAWEKYLQLDSNSEWATEASTRLERLRRRAALRDPDLTAIYQQVINADDEATARLWRDNFSEVADLLTNRLFDEYLNAKIQGPSVEATHFAKVYSRFATRIKEEKGEHFFSDLFDYVERVTPAQHNQVQAICNQLHQASNDIEQDGKFDQAVELLLQTEKQARNISDICHRELALLRLSFALNSQQNNRPEMGDLREWLREETAARNHRQLKVAALLADTNLYLADQRFYSAYKASTQALDDAQQINDRDNKIVASRRIVTIAPLIIDYETFLEKSQDSLKLLWESQPTNGQACREYAMIAEGLADAGRASMALTYALEAMNYCDKCSAMLQAAARGRVGAYYSQTGQLNAASQVFSEGLSLLESYSDNVGRRSLIPDFYPPLSDYYYQQGEFDKSESAVQTALQTLSGNEYYLSSKLQHQLAKVYLKQGKMEVAEAALKNSIKLIEDAQRDFSKGLMRGAFIKGNFDVFNSMIGFQYNQGEREKAFDYSERHRAGELLATLAKTKFERFEPRSTLLSYSISNAALTMSEVKQQLSADVQLVEYSIINDKLLIWVITKGNGQCFNVPITKTELEQNVNHYLDQLLSRKPESELDQSANFLYLTLVSQIAPLLDRNKLLVIVPDGCLHSLPFAALKSPENKRYLIEDYAIATNPSATIALRMMQREKKDNINPSLLTIGNPSFDTKLYSQLKQLPQADVECSEIAAFYKDKKNLSGATATASAVIRAMGTSDVVHFAAHSVTDEQNPLHSSIMLASEKLTTNQLESGTLTADQIFNLKLPRTRLVVLSSCSSASVSQLHDKGLGGLAHAFFSTGVPTVLASLWEVDDGSTSTLMSAFHQVNQSSRRAYSESLKLSQVNMLRSNTKWKHPYYWATFIVTGNGIIG